MTAGTYWILIEDADLALAVGAALEDRLSRDGHHALVLYPAPERRAVAAWAAGAILPAMQGSSANRLPHIVALYEDGLVESLKSLGLAAYVAVPPGAERHFLPWGNGAGAMLLPVSSARDLVEAVAECTPWPQHAAQMAALAAPKPEQPEPGKRSTLPRKLAIAGVAGPLMLAALPAATAAAETTSPAQAQPATRTFAGRVGGAVQRYKNYQGQVQLDNAQANIEMSRRVTTAAASLWPSWPNAAAGGENGFAYGTTAGFFAGDLGRGAAMGTTVGLINSYLNPRTGQHPARRNMNTLTPARRRAAAATRRQLGMGTAGSGQGSAGGGAQQGQGGAQQGQNPSQQGQNPSQQQGQDGSQQGQNGAQQGQDGSQQSQNPSQQQGQDGSQQGQNGNGTTSMSSGSMSTSGAGASSGFGSMSSGAFSSGASAASSGGGFSSGMSSGAGSSSYGGFSSGGLSGGGSSGGASTS